MSCVVFMNLIWIYWSTSRQLSIKKIPCCVLFNELSIKTFLMTSSAWRLHWSDLEGITFISGSYSFLDIRLPPLNTDCLYISSRNRSIIRTPHPDKYSVPLSLTRKKNYMRSTFAHLNKHFIYSVNFFHTVKTYQRGWL